MFFIFRIFILFMCACETNNFQLNKRNFQKNDEPKSNLLLRLQDFHGTPLNTQSQKHLIRILQNLTRGSNLRSNVNDKQLYDEMFAIMQQQENKGSYSVPNIITPKISLATPTLELKKKWPIVDLLSKSDTSNSLQYIDDFEKKYSNNYNETEENGSTTYKKDNLIIGSESESLQNESKEKIVGLRSLQGHSTRKHHTTGVKQCTCKNSDSSVKRDILRTNFPSSCTAKGSTEQNTVTTISYTLIPLYFNYLPYDPNSILGMTPSPNNFIGMAPGYSNLYYPPIIYNEGNIPKPPKHKRPHKVDTSITEDDLYYEDAYEDNEEYKVDDYLEHAKPNARTRRTKYKTTAELQKASNEHIKKQTSVQDDVLELQLDDTTIKNCQCMSSSNILKSQLLFVCFCFPYFY